MYTRYYDGYNQRPKGNSDNYHESKSENIKENVSLPEAPNVPESGEIHTAEASSDIGAIETASALPFRLPGNLKTDDLILLAVLFLILSDSNDDIILPLILGYLFISNI